MYLLDTNVWITALRRPGSQLAVRFRAVLPRDIRICSIVVSELLHGAYRSAKPVKNRAAVRALTAPFASLPFDDDAAERFAFVRHTLEQAGSPIGPYEMQIAAIALAQSCTLVTHNVAEFSRVPGLIVEDWQVP